MTENQKVIMSVLEENIKATAPGSEENARAVKAYNDFIHESNEGNRIASTEKVEKRKNIVALVSAGIGVVGSFAVAVFSGIVQAKGGIPIGERRHNDNLIDSIEKPKIK